jgi:hypothetical protein
MKDAEKKEADDSNVVEEVRTGKPEWAFQTTFFVDDLKRISFLVASHPIQDTPRDLRKFGICAEFYSEDGKVLYCIDSVNGGEVSGGKFISNCRDMTKKSSYDEMLILTLPSIPSEVNSIIFYTYSARTISGDFPYANYALMDYTTSQKLDSKRIKSDDFQADDNGNILPFYLAYRLSRKEQDPRTLKVVMVDGNAEVEMKKETSHWVLDIYNFPINKPFDEGKALISKVTSEGAAYTQRLVDGLIEYRKKKLLEEIEYKKQIEETEQPGSKKKKKRPAKGKTIEEPVKMTEYVPVNLGYPSRTFGPVFIDTTVDSVEDILQKVAQSLDSDLVNSWELGFNVLIKNKPIKKVPWVLKANTLKDLRVDCKLPEKEPVVVQDEENLE